MDPTLGVALLWLLFGGTHVLLATGRIRAGLVGGLGPIGFATLFSLVAAVTFALLVRFYTMHRWEGPAGIALGGMPAIRWVLVALIVLGVALMTASSAVYPGSPMSFFTGRRVRTPVGLERVTRHPFFAGTALFGAAHVLLATHLVGAVFAAGFVVLAVAGSWHQDRKLLAQRGPGYADYLAQTSAVPFVAILAGRQRLAWHELPGGTLAAGVVLAFVLRRVHDHIFAHDGVWVVVGVLVGATLLTVQAARAAAASQRTRTPETARLPRTT